MIGLVIKLIKTTDNGTFIMKNILITGHTGFIGKNLTNFLSNKFNIFGCSRSLSSNFRGNRQYALDICNLHELQTIVSSKQIDIIIHTAAKSIVKDCQINPYYSFKDNFLCSASVFETARLCNIEKIIHFETDKVYGNQPKDSIPTNEEHELRALSPYETSKAFGANLAKFYREFYDMDIISLRPANTFGPFDTNQTRIIPKTMINLINKKPPILHTGADKIYREFLFVNDLCRCVETIINNKTNYNVYNIASGEYYKIPDLIDKILKLLNMQIKVEQVSHDISLTEISNQRLNPSRFNEEFNFKYTNFDEALLKTWEFYSNLKNKGAVVDN